jgi:hypothetical protein
MATYLYHTGSGRMYEVVGVDAAAGTITLRNDMAAFTDNYDKEKFRQQGYIKVTGEDEDEARAAAEAKLAQDEEAA